MAPRSCFNKADRDGGSTDSVGEMPTQFAGEIYRRPAVNPAAGAERQSRARHGGELEQLQDFREAPSSKDLILLSPLDVPVVNWTSDVPFTGELPVLNRPARTVSPLVNRPNPLCTKSISLIRNEALSIGIIGDVVRRRCRRQSRQILSQRAEGGPSATCFAVDGHQWHESKTA
jgi:hypothetical protein